MEGTPGDSEYESQFLDDSDSQFLPRGELGCGAQADDEDAGFVTPVPPPRAPSRLAAAARPIAAPLLSTATVGATAGASRESSSLGYMSMQVGKATTDSLKFYLRRLNIIGIINKAKAMKADAVATRMLQLGVTVPQAYAASKGFVSRKEDLNDHMVEIEARDPGDPMPPREVGVALEVAVAKAGSPDSRAAGCAARVTVAPAGAKRRVQWPSSSTSPIFYEEAGFTYVRPGATATSGVGAGIGGAAAAVGSTQTGGASARSPPFTASDSCRLFHALIDGRMATARRLQNHAIAMNWTGSH
jgi:hypothetical protein